MKSIIKTTAIATLVMLSASAVHAAENAEVTVTGNIVNYTCDVSTNVANIDLGNFAKTAFVDATTKVGAKNFLVSVKNCSGTIAVNGTPLELMVTENGTSNSVDATNFWGDDAGTGTGIVLELTKGTDAAKKITPVNNRFELLAADDTDPQDLANVNYTLNAVTAMMAKEVTAVSTGKVKAQLMFTMAY